MGPNSTQEVISSRVLHHAMEMYEERGQLYKLSTSAADKAGWSAICSGSWLRAPGTHKMTGGWVGQTTGLDIKEEKFLS
jgi:hypothetical protein